MKCFLKRALLFFCVSVGLVLLFQHGIYADNYIEEITDAINEGVIINELRNAMR